MRSLWTSASGMQAQQTRLDAIGHNLSNVGTTGYKAQEVQFKDMLYAQFAQKPLVGDLGTRAGGAGLSIGHGVMVNGITNSFAQGNLQNTNVPLDLAIEGSGFFKVGLYQNGVQAGEAYTRAGSFKVGVTPGGNPTPYLVDSQGNPVLDTTDNPIDLTGFDLNTLSVDQAGNMKAHRVPSNGGPEDIAQLNVVRIDNPETNLRSVGSNVYAVVDGAAASVRPIGQLAANEQPPHVRQGMVEMSNVDMAKSFTDMIVAQRMYSMNSRALQTADQMMGMANNLRNG